MNETIVGKRAMLTGAAWAVFAIAIWASWMVVTRLDLLQTGLNVFDVTAIRFATAAILLAPVAIRRGVWPATMTTLEKSVLVFGAGAPYALLAGEGLMHAPAAHAGALIPGMMPVFAAILSVVFLRENTNRSRRIGLLLAPVGASLIVGLDLACGGEALLGHALFLAASISWASYTVTLRRSGLAPIHAVAIVVFWSALLYLPLYAALLPKGVASVGWRTIGLQILFQGVLTSVVSLVAFNRAVTILGASRAALFAALVPALAALFAIPVLQEWPRPTEWLGISIVTVGVLLGSGAVSRTDRSMR